MSLRVQGCLLWCLPELLVSQILAAVLLANSATSAAQQICCWRVSKAFYSTDSLCTSRAIARKQAVSCRLQTTLTCLVRMVYKVHLASVCSRRVDHDCFAPLQLGTHGTVTIQNHYVANGSKRRKLWFNPLCRPSLLGETHAVYWRGSKAHRRHSGQPLHGLATGLGAHVC